MGKRNPYNLWEKEIRKIRGRNNKTMTGIIIFLLIISIISVGLLIWLAVWEFKHHTTANYIGAISAVVAAACIIALWVLVFTRIITL